MPSWKHPPSLNPILCACCRTRRVLPKAAAAAAAASAAAAAAAAAAADVKAAAEAATPSATEAPVLPATHTDAECEMLSADRPSASTAMDVDTDTVPAAQGGSSPPATVESAIPSAVEASSAPSPPQSPHAPPSTLTDASEMPESPSAEAGLKRKRTAVGHKTPSLLSFLSSPFPPRPVSRSAMMVLSSSLASGPIPSAGLPIRPETACPLEEMPCTKRWGRPFLRSALQAVLGIMQVRSCL